MIKENRIISTNDYLFLISFDTLDDVLIPHFIYISSFDSILGELCLRESWSVIDKML